MRRYVVDRRRFDENIRVVRHAAGQALIYGVLKAEGCGLGLEPMASALADQGIARFAVTEPEDAARLAAAVQAEEILLLRPVPAEAVEGLLRLGCVSFSVGGPEEAAALAQAGLRLGAAPQVHVQVDTGMGRYGVRWDEPEKLLYLYESFTALRFAGIYTHFACPARERATRRQFRRFLGALDELAAAGIDPGLRHCCGSEALLRYPDMRLDAVRVGSGFVGRTPGGESAGLRSAGWCEAEVETVRTLPAGARVGYGAQFRARRDMRAAVVDIGAIHGLGAGANHGRRSLPAGTRGLVCSFRDVLQGGSGLAGELRGRRVPVLGLTCSECAILDVTGVECAPGDMVRFSLNPLFCRGMDRVWSPPEHS